MNYTLYDGGALDSAADYLVAGDGVFTFKHLFGRWFPKVVLACEIRGLPAVLSPATGAWDHAWLNAHLAPTCHVLTSQAPLPAIDPRRLYQYVLARSGVFLLAKSRDVEICLPLADGDLPGLTSCAPLVRFLHPRVPASFVKDLFASARAACQTGAGAQERLFYLLEHNGAWQLVAPEQDASELSVQARAATPESFAAVLEGHSHHRAAAFFSQGDNTAELLHGGFRVFFVLGRIEESPEILTRVCVHGYDWLVPASLFFELPGDVRDAYWTGGWA